MAGTFFLRLRKKARAINRRYREARMVAAELKSPHRPILAQIIPVRRCNLSCVYCNEYDKTSEPGPVAWPDLDGGRGSAPPSRSGHRHASESLYCHCFIAPFTG